MFSHTRSYQVSTTSSRGHSPTEPTGPMNSVDLFEPSLMDFDDFDKELEWDMHPTLFGNDIEREVENADRAARSSSPTPTTYSSNASAETTSMCSSMDYSADSLPHPVVFHHLPAEPLSAFGEAPSTLPTSPPVRTSSHRMCKNCMTTKTPQWRRGPDGSMSLCNACGLRYFKFEKKKSRESSARNAAAAAPSSLATALSTPSWTEPPVASHHAGAASTAAPVDTTPVSITPALSLIGESPSYGYLY